MIQVTIYQDQNQNFVGFEMLGHAGYAEAGQDIVCAAVSILSINTINAIEAFTQDNMDISSDEETGSLVCTFKGTPSKDASLLLKTMVMGLTDLSNDEIYETYIDLIFEEV